MWLQEHCECALSNVAWCSNDARYASNTGGRSAQGMVPKATDDQEMQDKKAKKKEAAQQLAASWQSDFEPHIIQGKMPQEFAGMHLFFALQLCYSPH